jgi:hypothetical protein
MPCVASKGDVMRLTRALAVIAVLLAAAALNFVIGTASPCDGG